VATNKRREAEKRSAAAAKAAEMRRAHESAERRRRILVVSAVVVALLVIVVGAAILVQGERNQTDAAAGDVPGVTADFGFVVGKPDAAVDVVIYEDFQCPACEQFETASGSTLDSYVDDGTVSVEYRPIAFLDRMSSTDYSTRSLNAAACVMDDAGVDAFKKFHDTLFQNQPPEGGDGLPDSTLVDYAAQAGADKSAVQSCVDDETYKDWTKAATEAASKNDVTGTPTVFIDGEQFKDIGTPGAFEQAIKDAAGTQ